MRATFILIIFCLISILSFSQINFENAYFIDNSNQRIECLIKNNDWKNNPTEFEYKLNSTSEVEKGTLSTVKEFGITGFSRYVKANTKIDISSSVVENLSKNRNPDWSQQTLFLKVLVEGKAMLYYYEKSGLIRFFYSKSDSAIDQLIFKEYYDTTKTYYVENCEYAVNKKFHDQLWTNVRCANTTTNVIEQLNYRKSDLLKYFIKYNECCNVVPVVYEKKAGKDAFHLKITPGICYSSLIISNTHYENYDAKFDNQLNFRMGLEGEYVLPFNKNKWSILLEPTFQYFNAKVEKSNANLTINFNAIEFPIGCRYAFFLNQKWKFFVDALYISNLSFGFNSTFIYETTTSSILPITLELKGGQSLAFGGGIGNKKLSAELRYYTDRDIFSDYKSWYIDYQKYMLILGFNIF